MRNDPQIVIRTSAQDSAFIDHDIRVTDIDLLQMYEKGRELLDKIGGKISSEESPLGPEAWVEEGIIAAPVAEDIYRIGNCLVRNSFYPVGLMGTRHEFVVLGRDEGADKLIEKLRNQVRFKNFGPEYEQTISDRTRILASVGIEGFTPEHYLDDIQRLQINLFRERE